MSTVSVGRIFAEVLAQDIKHPTYAEFVDAWTRMPLPARGQVMDSVHDYLVKELGAENVTSYTKSTSK